MRDRLHEWISNPSYPQYTIQRSCSHQCKAEPAGLTTKRRENLNDSSKLLNIKPQEHLPRPCFSTSSISCSSSSELHFPFFKSQCNTFKYLQKENITARNIKSCLSKSDHHCTPRLKKSSIPSPLFKGLVPGLNSPLPALGVAPARHFCLDFVPLLLPVLLNCSHQHLCAPDKARTDILTSINPNRPETAAVLFVSCPNLCTKLYRSF